MLGALDQSCSAQRGVPMTALIRASAPSQVQLTAILTRLHVVAGCIHNDISARNVFICTNSGVVRLANFFFSQFPKRVPGASIHLSKSASQNHPHLLLIRFLQLPVSS